MKLRVTTQPETQTFYGHGKLLITGEYFVLDGALALALPTRLGQSLRVTELHSSESILYWVALNSKKQAWLNLTFDTTTFSCINSKDEVAQRLSTILQQTRKLNPEFLAHHKDIAVETHLEFPNEWGLGSSSTLIHCISKWAGIDGYELLKNTIGGSGYDVACADAKGAIIYQLEAGKPKTVAYNWLPPFKDKIYFAYTGNKQLSSEAIKYYKAHLNDKTEGVASLSQITETILKCTSISEFEELIREHENIIGAQLKQIKVGDTIFADYWGTVKSLGAWGGDFVMMTNEKTEAELKEYLKQKNISIAFSWDEIILNSNTN